MKVRLSVILVCCVASIVVGCVNSPPVNLAAAPTDEEIRSADYGLPVSFEVCKSVAEAAIRKRMRDPDSTQFNSVGCRKSYWLDHHSGTVFGYLFTGNYNSKNGFGGYIGFRPFRGVIRDNGNGPRVVKLRTFN